MSIIDLYAHFTQFIVDATGMTRAMLHLHAGMTIYLAAQFFLRDRRSSIYALVIVVQVEILNEIMNWLHRGDWRWPDTISDVLLTIFWPTICYAVGTYRRKKWKGAPPQKLHDAQVLQIERA